MLTDMVKVLTYIVKVLTEMLKVLTEMVKDGVFTFAHKNEEKCWVASGFWVLLSNKSYNTKRIIWYD